MQNGDFYVTRAGNRIADHDFAEAHDDYRMAAELGHCRAQYKYALILEEAGETASALTWYRRAAEQGHATAAYLLAQGASATFGLDERIKWLKVAYDGGLLKAAIDLANYELAQGNDASARSFLEAAAADVPQAKVELAILAHRGRGEPRSHAKFVALLAELSADEVGPARNHTVEGCDGCAAEREQRLRAAEEFARAHIVYRGQYIPVAELNLDHYEGDDPVLVAEDIQLRPYFVCANRQPTPHLWRKDDLHFAPRYLGYRTTRCRECFDRELQLLRNQN